jgi:hypothetical protein
VKSVLTLSKMKIRFCNYLANIFIIKHAFYHGLKNTILALLADMNYLLMIWSMKVEDKIQLMELMGVILKILSISCFIIRD